jgi:hypothetical protein
MVRTILVLSGMILSAAGCAAAPMSRDCSSVQWSTPELVWSSSTESERSLLSAGEPNLLLGAAEPIAVAALAPPVSKPSADPPERSYLVAQRIGGPSLGAPAEGASFGDPVAALDPEGTLHMVWAEPGPREIKAFGPAGYTRLMYAQYRDGRWWPAEQIYEGGEIKWDSAVNPSLVIDREGNVHTLVRALLPDEFYPAMFHLRSGPGGWKVTRVSKLTRPPRPGLDHRTGLWPNSGAGGSPRLALGPGRRLYLVTLAAVTDPQNRGKSDPPDGRNSLWVWRSEDLGDTWSERPLLVSHRGQEDGREPQILAVGRDTVHLVSVQQLLGEGKREVIWHSLSTDGGKTWSEPAEIRPPVGAFFLRNTHLVRTADGALHLAFAALYGRDGGDPVWVAYHARWEHGRWGPISRLLPQAPQTGIPWFDLEVDHAGGLHVLWTTNTVPTPPEKAASNTRLWYAKALPCRTGTVPGGDS